MNGCHLRWQTAVPGRTLDVASTIVRIGHNGPPFRQISGAITVQYFQRCLNGPAQEEVFGKSQPPSPPVLLRCEPGRIIPQRISLFVVCKRPVVTGRFFFGVPVGRSALLASCLLSLSGVPHSSPLVLFPDRASRPPRLLICVPVGALLLPAS